MAQSANKDSPIAVVIVDASGNPVVPIAVGSYTTTATAAGTTTLTSASTLWQFFTGSTTQTVVLPVTSTMTLGQQFVIVNNSTGTVTVNSSGSNLVVSLIGGAWAFITCIALTGTTAASWSVEQPLDASLNLGDVASIPTSRLNLLNYTTTATAAGTTTLTVASTYNQYFTGSTTQTVTLPVASTMTVGMAFRIVNNSTGLVTINSSGANAVWLLGAGTAVIITCIVASGTDATSWDAKGPPILSFEAAASDETTALTAGTAKVTFAQPYATPFYVTAVYASLTTAQASGNIFTVDINEAGTTILSTKLTIDNTETDSSTAATPPVISDAVIAGRAAISVDIDQIGDGSAKGLKVTIIGHQ